MATFRPLPASTARPALPSPSPSRSRRAAGAVVAGGALLLTVVTLILREDSRSPDRQGDAPAARVAPRLLEAPSPIAGGLAPTETASRSGPPAAGAERSEQRRTEGEDPPSSPYVAREAARPPARALPFTESGPGEKFMRLYGGQSGRLAEGESFERRHGPRPMSFQGTPVVVWTSKRHLDPGDSTTVFVAPNQPDVSIVAATLELRAGANRKQVAMSVDRGVARGDFQADGTFRDPRAGGAPTLVDAVVELELARQGQRLQRQVSTLFFVQDSGARLLTETASISVDGDGNARLSVELDVRIADHYYLYAELWSTKEEASLAFGRKGLGRLETGRQRVEVMFGGQVLRERGIDGPYAVRNVELSRVSSEPPHLAPPIAELLTTPAWRAADFR